VFRLDRRVEFGDDGTAHARAVGLFRSGAKFPLIDPTCEG